MTPSNLFFTKQNNSWLAFEEYVFEQLENKYPDCRIIPQLRLGSGLRPDFVLECDSKQIVVDAKARLKIEKRDIMQMVDYLLELDADFGIIFVPDYTEVSEAIETFAAEYAIEIEYTDWKFD